MPTNNESQARSIPATWLALWWFIILGHMATWLGLLVCCICSFFLQPWYITFPMIAFCVYLLTTDYECPVTRWENHVRDRLGWQRVPHFTHWYVICPLFHGRACNRKCVPVQLGPR